MGRPTASTHVRELIGFGFSEKPGTVYISLCGPSIIGIDIYKLSARVTGMVIDLEQMESKC